VSGKSAAHAPLTLRSHDLPTARCEFCDRSMSSCVPNFVKTSQIAAELWRFPFSKWRPAAILDFATGHKWRYGRLRTVHVYHRAKLGDCRLSQPAAELLRFVENFDMAASAILNLYLAILDHARTPLMDLKSHGKFGVNRTFTFQDIVILKVCKFGLERLFRPSKFTFLGILTSKCYFSLLRPPKGTTLAGNTRFHPSLVVVRRAVQPGR